jgi:hypothetical protein
MANERGSYGPSGSEEGKGNSGLAILLLAGVTAGIYALSPGARHFYKHGRLPSLPTEETGQWRRGR